MEGTFVRKSVTNIYCSYFKFTIAITIYLRSYKCLLVEQIKCKVHYHKHKELTFGNKFIHVEEQKLCCYFSWRVCRSPCSLHTEDNVNRLLSIFGCEAVFGSTVQAEKIRESHILRYFDEAVTSQFVIDKDLCED